MLFIYHPLRRFNVGAERIEGGCGANVGKINGGKFACLAEGVVTKIIISRGLLMTGTCNYYVTADNPIYSTTYAMAFPVSMFTFFRLGHLDANNPIVHLDLTDQPLMYVVVFRFFSRRV